MKHIYVNVSSYFTKKNDVQLWKSICSSFEIKCDEECLITFVCCDLKKEGFHILDGNIFEDKLSDIIKETVSFNSFEPGSVYFDIISSEKTFPPRNYIYRNLKRAGMQIVSFLHNSIFNMIQDLANYSEDEVISAIDSLSAAISYGSYIILENNTDIEIFHSICAEMNANVPECSVFYENTLLKTLCATSKEKGSVSYTDLYQMVVLTARNDDIMKSLPYIEEFMPFIKELVVCCPPQNVQSFKIKYNGRLSLKFITDDELLNGESLPKDHQARNFFLRCKLMDQDVLNDVFIMTDDDYRPMKPITKEFFIKDGRYQGYYFYDIRDWQGTYNNYTSFDKGAFKTRDFLIQHDYPVLQYSSHQPQIIDRHIFKEMLSVHKGIEYKPYDEWSTYFNYGFYFYPDKFKPCESVSMCWPGDMASWDVHHVPREYFFENYYEELYKEGQMFEGFSEKYCENTERENLEKSRIYRKKSLRQLRENEAFLDYQREYADKKGIYPSIVIDFDEKSGKINLTVPEYINLSVDAWVRVPVAIQKAVYDSYDSAENIDVFISYHFVNSIGVPVLNSPEIQIKTGDMRFKLPVRSPASQLKNAVMMVRVILREKTEDNSFSEKHPVFTVEKSMKLMLTKIDEVDYV